MLMRGSLLDRSAPAMSMPSRQDGWRDELPMNQSTCMKVKSIEAAPEAQLTEA
jgi:hypothetical protein